MKEVKPIQPAEILGVDPKSRTIPRQFDPRNVELWSRAYRLPEDKRVAEYLRLCNGLGRNPFRHVNGSQNNLVITFAMRKLRRELVKYIDSWNILQKTLMERIPPVTFKVKRFDQGFELHGMLLLRNNPVGPMRKWLSMNNFFQYNGPYKLGKWDWHRKFAGKPYEIGVSAANDFETFVWYTMRFDETPYVSEVMHTDSEMAFAEFVIRRLWLPVILTQRLSTTKAKF
jgi:hypothetical protein